MRKWIALIGVCVVVFGGTAVYIAAEVNRADPAAVGSTSSPPSRVPCDQAIGPQSAEEVASYHELLLGHVSLPPTEELLQVARRYRGAPYLFSKVGIAVLTDQAVVVAAAPRHRRSYSLDYAGRSPMRVEEGDAAVQFGPCPGFGPDSAWNVFPGLILLRRPECLELHISVGGKSAVRRLSVGRRCAATSTD